MALFTTAQIAIMRERKEILEHIVNNPVFAKWFEKLAAASLKNVATPEVWDEIDTLFDTLACKLAVLVSELPERHTVELRNLRKIFQLTVDGYTSAIKNNSNNSELFNKNEIYKCLERIISRGTKPF